MIKAITKFRNISGKEFATHKEAAFDELVQSISSVATININAAERIILNWEAVKQTVKDSDYYEYIKNAKMDAEREGITS